LNSSPHFRTLTDHLFCVGTSTIAGGGEDLGFGKHRFIFLNSPTQADGTSFLYVDGVGTTLQAIGQGKDEVQFNAPDGKLIVWKMAPKLPSAHSAAPAAAPPRGLQVPFAAAGVSQQPRVGALPQVWQGGGGGGGGGGGSGGGDLRPPSASAPQPSWSDQSSATDPPPPPPPYESTSAKHMSAARIASV
jgi:hypothetical protein